MTALALMLGTAAGVVQATGSQRERPLPKSTRVAESPAAKPAAEAPKAEQRVKRYKVSTGKASKKVEASRKIEKQ